MCVVAGISRWFAVSKSQLDWDESLFALGVRKYDVALQHPHPPGYPLFMLLAKIVRLAVADDFRSIQIVVVAAAVLLFPATFFLLRELRLNFRVAITGAVITAFLPTVWYYGGTALSDIPALCAVVFASALLLAGARDPRAWIAGMFVAGIAGGIRPLHVAIAAVPAIIGAAAMRRPRTIMNGCAVFALVTAASYAGAAMATSNPPWGYLREIGVTTRYIGSTDSFSNATRPPLRELAPRFFVHAHGGGRAGFALIVLAILGLAEATIRRRVSVGIILAMFVPIAIASWMMLDQTAATRYALAYVMLYSVLAAYGIDVLVAIVRNPTVRNAIAAAVTITLTLAMIAWTRPALAIVHHQAAPPIAAMQWIRANVPAVGPRLWVDASAGFHAEHELAGYDVHRFDSYDQIPADAYAPGNYCLVDRRTLQPHFHYFSFPRTRLPQIARDMYFESSLIPMNAMIRFGEGWYPEESDGERTHAWRWMQESSSTLFPPIGSDGILRLKFYLPLDALPRPTKVTVIWNGNVIEQSFCKDSNNDRRYVLPSRAESPNECRILVDQVARLKEDPRLFGLELFSVSWERADGLRYGF